MASHSTCGTFSDRSKNQVLYCVKIIRTSDLRFGAWRLPTEIDIELKTGKNT